MKRRTMWIVAGVLVVAGAAATMAVAQREGRFGHRGMMGEPGDGMGPDMMGGMMGGGMMGRGMMGHDGEHRGRGRWMRGEDGDGDGGRRGFGFWRGGRSMTAEQFDTNTRERFARFDRNSDGVIDAAEVEAGITARSGERRPFMEMMGRRFQGRFDTSRDGKVTREEFTERVRTMFGRFDLDGDGRITDDDLPPMMRGQGVLKGDAARPGRGMMGRLAAADANRDGIITLDEALAEANRQFDRIDRNKDGVIDQADQDAMRKEMVDYGVRRFMHAHGAGKDGRVTREQFYAAAKQRFAERDINSDGRIDRDDIMPGMGRGGRGGRGMMGPGGPGSGGPGMGGPGMGGPGTGSDSGARPERAPSR